MNNMQPFHNFAMSYMTDPGTRPIFLGVLGVLAIWTLVWKGYALWHSARNHQKVWFFFLLIVNTLGILEIIYLAFFRKNKNDLVHTTTVTKVHTVTASTPAGAPSDATTSTSSSDMSSSTPTS
jgi:Family of unknown function (DUF5652)